jgi:hypothetical protein
MKLKKKEISRPNFLSNPGLKLNNMKAVWM